MNELQINVTNPKSDFVRVGNDIVELEDHSTCIFSTNSIEAFKDYLQKEDPKGAENNIYFNQFSVQAFPCEPDCYSKTTAICKLEISKQLQLLKNAEGSSMDRDQFENFLRCVGKYGDDSVMDLFSWVKNFELKTINSIQRKKDHDGSFRLLISREKAEKESYSPPTEVSFSVPVFKMMENKIKLSFEFYFDYANYEDKITTSFKIINVELDELIHEAQKEIVLESIKDIQNKKLWGSISLEVQDDSWKYQENKLYE